MGRFTLIPNKGYLDEAFLMESIYTLFDKEKLPYIVKANPDETDEQIVMCGSNIEQIEFLKKNKNIKHVVFLPNSYMDENLINLLDERFVVFCQDTESFDFIQKNSTKTKVYFADNLGFKVTLNDIQCPTKMSKEIPLGKRYLIWHLAASFISKIKKLHLKNTVYQVGYFLKGSNLPEAEDISLYYFGKQTQRSITKWLATLFIGIIKAPDIIVTNLFLVALVADRLGKIVFLWQDKSTQRIKHTKLGNSQHLFFLAPKQNIQTDVYNILQNISFFQTVSLKLFYSLNPVPEADIKLKLLQFKRRIPSLNKNMLLFKPKVVHLVFITDENYALMTGVAIQSAIENKNPKNQYDIRILGYRLTAVTQKKLLALNRKNVQITIIEVFSLEKFKNIKQTRYITPTALLKFDLPTIFNKLDKVLYLDGDVFIQGDLWEFYNKNIRRNYAAVVKDAVSLTPKVHQQQSVCKNDNYFNSGVLLLNLKKMRQDNIPQKLLEWRLHHGTYFMDQDALNAVLSPNIKTLNCWYNFLSHYPFSYPSKQLSAFYQTEIPNDFLSSYKRALVLHYAGKLKPYRTNQPYLTDEFMKYLSKTMFRNYLNKIKFVDEAYNHYYEQFRKYGWSLDRKEGKYFLSNGNIKISGKFDNTLWTAYGVFCTDEYAFFDEKKYIMLDIGFNLGFTSLRMSLEENIVKIYAFEPFIPTYTEGMENLRMNPRLAKKIQVFK